MSAHIFQQYFGHTYLWLPVLIWVFRVPWITRSLKLIPRQWRCCVDLRLPWETDAMWHVEVENHTAVRLQSHQAMTGNHNPPVYEDEARVRQSWQAVFVKFCWWWSDMDIASAESLCIQYTVHTSRALITCFCCLLVVCNSVFKFWPGRLYTVHIFQ